MPKTIGIKLTDSDLAKWESCAEAEGLTLTAWIRQKVNLGLAESPKKVNHGAQKEANPTEKVNLVEPEKAEKPQKSRGKSPCHAFGRHDLAMIDGAVKCRRCGWQA